MLLLNAERIHRKGGSPSFIRPAACRPDAPVTPLFPQLLVVKRRIARRAARVTATRSRAVKINISVQVEVSR
jgi:hypothetical protein